MKQAYPDLFVTASHELSQEYREFERTSTVAANAYVGPRVQALSRRRCASGICEEGIRRHRSSSCSRPAACSTSRTRSGPASACWNPVRLPASSAPRRCATRSGCAMRSPSTWAAPPPRPGSSIEGQVLMTGNSMIGGYASGLPVQMPMIDIQEVGTGGGSIARVETGGALRVGPESAGAEPGPVCYGLGGMRADGYRCQSHARPARRRSFPRRRDAARPRRRPKTALDERIAEPLGLTVTAGGGGHHPRRHDQMSHVVRWVTTERGLDAADFALVAYGGAGPLHAVDGRARTAHRPKS